MPEETEMKELQCIGHAVLTSLFSADAWRKVMQWGLVETVYMLEVQMTKK